MKKPEWHFMQTPKEKAKKIVDKFLEFTQE